MTSRKDSYLVVREGSLLLSNEDIKVDRPNIAIDGF